MTPWFVLWWRSVIPLVLLVVCVTFAAHAQDHPNSPVFKDRRLSPFTSLVVPSDATYQLWEGFMLARKANAGDVPAQHELGIRYLLGKGFIADTVRGAYWIVKAAKKNLMPARFNLGILQYNGWGVAWNPFEAYGNFRYCAEQGMPEAEFVLGQFLTDNLVVPKDWEKAYEWVKRAADQGYAPAAEALPEFRKRLPRGTTDIGKGTSATQPIDSLANRSGGNNQTLGLIFLDFDTDTTEHAEDPVLLRDVLRSGNSQLQKALGLADSVTSGIDVDSTALALLERAAGAGSPEALSILGRCYERGIEVHRDLLLAGVYYVRAIRMDSPRAPEMLWNLMQERRFADRLGTALTGGEPDALYLRAALLALGYAALPSNPRIGLTPEEALHMLQRAADQRYIPALIELGLCYYGGRWVPPNRRTARDLWQRAAGLGSSEASVRIAVMDVQESGESPSRAESVSLLLQGVEEGSVIAQMALGYCYEKGVVVDRNMGEAAKLYRSAAQRGSQDAFRSLQRLYDELRPDEPEFQIAHSR